MFRWILLFVLAPLRADIVGGLNFQSFGFREPSVAFGDQPIDRHNLSKQLLKEIDAPPARRHVRLAVEDDSQLLFNIRRDLRVQCFCGRAANVPCRFDSNRVSVEKVVMGRV